eukprot:TRINITY_DN193_c0_g1_i4.p1 TRINITY_DN193_c0_g1~~TRINITY_DN193_c0_g1_i4.p1  ORF type:complete len:521 (-),score=121.79 TRINITY_DN193_c0_g1_i4:489-2051(-)
MSREPGTSEDVVPVETEAGPPPTEDESTSQRYMLVMLRSFDFGVPYSEDGILPTRTRVNPFYSHPREGTVSFKVGNGVPFRLGYDGRKRFLRKDVILDHTDKFKNVIVYAGPAEHINMEVKVEESDEEVRRVLEKATMGASFVSQVFTGASTVANFVPHPYAQAGGLVLLLLASASRIAAAANEFASELIDDDVEFHAIQGITGSTGHRELCGELVLERRSRDESDDENDPGDKDSDKEKEPKMRFVFDVIYPEPLTHKRLLNVVIRKGVLHHDTFGDSKKKQLVLGCQLGTGAEDEKRNIITQRLNQGRGATLDRVCKIDNMLLGNLVCETNVVPFTVTAAVMLTARAKEQAKALAKFVNKVGPELTQSMGYAYQLYNKLRTAKLEEEKDELAAQAHADEGEKLRAVSKIAKLQRRIAELPDGPRKDALQAQLEELQMENSVDAEIRTAREAERKARTEELAWLLENLKKPKGALDGFAQKIATAADAKKAVRRVRIMRPIIILSIVTALLVAAHSLWS